MKSEAGFTLVEVLVVLVAGSLLMVSLSWVLQGAARDFRQAVSADAQSPRTDGLETLARLIEGAQPGATQGADSFNSNEVGYIVETPTALQTPGSARLTLSVRGNSGDRQLVAELQPLSGDGPSGMPVESILLSGVSGLELDVGTASRAGLPGPLTLEFEQGGKQHKLIFRPRITADGICRFDPISLACRT